MWPTEEARGGPGRASSVAEGRERDDFWIQKSVRDQLFTLFCIFNNKVRKPGREKRGWSDNGFLNPLCLPLKLQGLMLAPRALCPFQGGGTGDGAPL